MQIRKELQTDWMWVLLCTSWVCVESFQKEGELDVYSHAGAGCRPILSGSLIFNFLKIDLPLLKNGEISHLKQLSFLASL